MHVGLFHTRAGWRHAGGKAIFVRKLAAALATDHETTLYTQFDPRSDVVTRLKEAGVRLVAIPQSRSTAAERVVDTAVPLGQDPLLPLTRAVTNGIVSDIDDRLDLLLTHRFLEDLVLSNLVDIPVAYQYHNVQQVGAGAILRERFSKATIHLANSETIAAEVASKLDREVDGIVSPGVDTDRFIPTVSKAPLDGDQTVLFVGRIVQSKGVFDLLKAVAAIPDQPSVYIVGSGEIPDARLTARTLGIENSVQFLGEIDHADLPQYYAAADIFCNPTHYEGFGMVNIEAMACGTTVVTTRLPSIEEYAVDGDNAMLVAPESPQSIANALQSLLAAPSRRRELARAGRETALNYDWEVQAERLLEICAPATTRPYR